MPGSAEDSPANSPTQTPRSSQGRILIDEDPNRIWDDLPKHLKLKKRTAYIRRHSDFKVSSNYRKFILLMWKNYIVMKRRWKTSLVQLASPVLLTTILVIIISNRPNTKNPEIRYKPFNVDSPPESMFDGGCETVYIRPENNATAELITHLRDIVSATIANRLKFDFLNIPPDVTPMDLCALIEFEIDQWKNSKIDDDIFPPTISYDIRFPAVQDSGTGLAKKSLVSIGKEWDTPFRYPTYLVDGPREINNNVGGHPGYYAKGFLYIQNLIAVELMEINFIRESLKLDSSRTEASYEEEFETFKSKLSFRLVRFPFPAHGNEDAVSTIHDVLPLVLVTGFGISGVTMVFLSVREKEMGIRSLLTMYGIDIGFHRYAWILHNFMFQSISALLITAILSTNWTSDGTGIFNDVVSHVFFVLIACYVFNIICTITLMVCFFSHATTACISMCFIWTAAYIPYIYVKTYYNILTFWERLTACLCFNTAISIGCHIISEIETLDEGLNWKTVFGKDISEYSLGWVMVVMVMTGCIQLLFSQYISKVFSDPGMPSLPWNYLFKAWYWKDILAPDVAHNIISERVQEASFEDRHPEYFEDDSATKRRKELSIENISKYHGQLRAVHKLNLVCYQGHITVLLGDQGSGKSTLLQMLNGTTAPSSGIIQLSRKDLYKNPNLSRAFVGYCPSTDLLFPDLTVDETLQFFTDLKGLTNRIEAYEEVERFLRITLLVDYRDTRCCDLTTSSQRMLMVATAFCGGSRIVLLDDPTLNLSAAQQRVLWEFTGQEKKHRTIVVAMDLVHEVDSVVDKIVLLHYGQVTARGSPDFLKTKFGGGYHLDLNIKENCDITELEQLICRRVNGSRMFMTEGNLVDFYLPESETASFPGILEDLETSMAAYGLNSIKIRFVTLEELHLRLKRKSAFLDNVKKEENEPEDGPGRKKSRKSIQASKPKISQDQNPSTDFTPTGGFHHFVKEFTLMFKKNVKYTFRHGVLLSGATVVPLSLLMVTHFLTGIVEMDLETVAHHLKYADYMHPYIISDIYKSTNEGVEMRASVERLLSKANGIKRTEVIFNEDIPTEVLKLYRLVGKEKKIPDLGIELSPVLELEDVNGVPVEKLKVGITGYFNNRPLHTPAVSAALMHNVLFGYVEDYIEKQNTAPYVKKGYNLQVTNHPLKYQPADIIRYSELLLGPGYVFGFCTAFAYSFLIASFLIMHIDEQDFRHLQMMVGANKFIFWGTNYLWNFIIFTFVAVLHILFLCVAGVPGIPSKNWEHIPVLKSMFVFILIYGMTAACIVGTYASVSFKSWGRGFSHIALFFIISGPLIMLLMVQAQNEKIGISRGVVDFFHSVFMLLPSYSFGIGMFYIVANEVHLEQCIKYGLVTGGYVCNNVLVTPFNEFSHDGSMLDTCCFNARQMEFSYVAYGVGRNAFTMFLVMVGCIMQKIFTYSKKMRELEKKALEKKSRQWRPLNFNEHEIRDYDVLAETAKIYRGEDKHDLTIKNLTLETPLYIKMDNVCLEVKKGECFALLGSMGAGKSSFLKTMVRYPGMIPSYGDIELRGLSLLKNYEQYIPCFSYAADKNPFISAMTGEEVLQLIGCLRRMPPNILEQHINNLSTKLMMRIEMEQSIKGYSHVHVKKLCAAAALLGKFEILLLDEPTHHVDPESREFIISTVKKLMKNGCIVIWTSHSIEQCESICTKMSILVNGHLRCIGNLDHLRALYEEGFTVIVRFALDKDMIYFTSKKNIRMENEIRDHEVDEETGLPIGMTTYDIRKQNLTEVLHEDAEQALSELAPWEQDLCQFVAFFGRAFPDSILVDKQPGFVHYHVHQDQATWSALFTKMEEAKAVADVDTYYIACTNLDQVFFNFTRGQVTYES